MKLPVFDTISLIFHKNAIIILFVSKQKFEMLIYFYYSKKKKMQHLVLFLFRNINKHVYWIKNTAVGMLTNNNKKILSLLKIYF